jgi:ATP/maltotriose-dependent transcriptional regulator MalT
MTEARALRVEALAIARDSADPETLFLAASYLLSSPGSTAARHQAERRRLAQEATGWPRDRVSGQTLARVLWHAGRVALAEGNRSGAVELWLQLEDLTRRTNLLAGLLVLERDAVLACLDGRLEEALVLLEQLRQQSENAGASLRGLAHTYLTQLELALLLGQPADGLDKWDGYIARWPTAGENAFTPPALVVGRALALAALGRLDEARSLAGPLLDQLQEMDFQDSWGEIIHLVLGLQCAIALEHRPAARILAAQLECVAQVSMEQWAITSMPRQLAAASVLNGDLAAAHAYCARALETAGKIGFRPDIALTHVQLAELLLHEGKSGQAQRHLDIAIPELNEMHMQPAHMRALSLAALAERGDLPETVGGLALDGLTRRERDVARLIANGRTNHEIAEALVITEGTVEVHVKHILGKLGFRSRSQVATWVVENQHGAA